MIAGWDMTTLRELGRRAHMDGCYAADGHDAGLEIRKGRARGHGHDLAVWMMLGLAGSWARSGNPTTRLSPAALQRMIASPPDRRPRSPWPAWVLELPDAQRDITLATPAGVLESVCAVIALCFDDRWSWFALAGRVEYSEIGRTTEQLRDDFDDGKHNVPKQYRVEMVDADRRATHLLRRLILNTSNALHELDGVRRVGMERGAQDRGLFPAGDYELT